MYLYESDYHELRFLLPSWEKEARTQSAPVSKDFAIKNRQVDFV
jgi:hypothetical protein